MKNKTIKDYLKTIEFKTEDGEIRKHELFDYQKIWEDPAPIFLVISERGAKGKSTQAKKLAKDISDVHNLKSMWVMNTERLLVKERNSHLTKPKQYLNETFHNTHVEGSYVMKTNGDKKEIYTIFASLSTAENEKGSRDDIGLLIYDEFNVGLTQIRTKQVDLFSSLIATLTDPVNLEDDNFKKLIIHGNNKSLNNELLINLGVLSITEPLTDVYVGGFLLMRILSPEFTPEQRQEIKKINSNNWKFILQEKLGTAGHVYFNENLHDELNNVDMSLSNEPEHEAYMIKVDKKYFGLKIIMHPTLKQYVAYFFPMEYNPMEHKYVYALNKKSVEEGITLNTEIKKNLLEYLSKDKVYFHSAFVREVIIGEIVK